MIFVLLKKLDTYWVKKSKCEYTNFLSNNQIFLFQKHTVFVITLRLVTCVTTQFVYNLIDSFIILFYRFSTIQFNHLVLKINYWKNLFFSITNSIPLLRSPEITQQVLKQKNYKKNIKTNLSRLFSYFPFKSSERSKVTIARLLK